MRDVVRERIPVADGAGFLGLHLSAASGERSPAMAQRVDGIEECTLSGSESPSSSRTPTEVPKPQSPAAFIVSHRLHAWWPAVIWAVVMFYASTDAFSSENTGRIIEPILRWFRPGITQEQLDLVNYVLRKCAHLTEYFVLYLLVYRGFSNARARWRWSWALGACLVAVGYAVLDEIHQSFAISRTASPWDSLLDSSGALIALLVAYAFLRFRDPRPLG